MSWQGSDRINGDRINWLFHLLINGIYRGYNRYNPLILSFDPNFQQDIQVYLWIKRYHTVAHLDSVGHGSAKAFLRMAVLNISDGPLLTSYRWSLNLYPIGSMDENNPDCLGYIGAVGIMI